MKHTFERWKIEHENSKNKNAGVVVEETFEFGYDRVELFTKPIVPSKLPKDVPSLDTLLADT
jgi:hypothetical protein